MPRQEQRWEIMVQLFAQPMAAKVGQASQAERGILSIAFPSPIPTQERPWDMVIRIQNWESSSTPSSFVQQMVVQIGRANQAERQIRLEVFSSSIPT